MASGRLVGWSGATPHNDLLQPKPINPLHMYHKTAGSLAEEAMAWVIIDEPLHKVIKANGSFQYFVHFPYAEDAEDVVDLMREPDELFKLVHSMPSALVEDGREVLFYPGDTLGVTINTIPSFSFRIFLYRRGDGHTPSLRSQPYQFHPDCRIGDQFKFYLCVYNMKAVTNGNVLFFEIRGEAEHNELATSNHRRQENDICALCCDRVKQWTFACGHIFCKVCAEKALVNNLPAGCPDQYRCPIRCRSSPLLFPVRYLYSLCVVDNCRPRSFEGYCAQPCGCFYGPCLPTGRSGQQIWKKGEENWFQSTQGDAQCLRCERQVDYLMKIFP
ncbi:unnamed protein product, partial [Mesorhabditis spiculigera]